MHFSTLFIIKLKLLLASNSVNNKLSVQSIPKLLKLKIVVPASNANRQTLKKSTQTKEEIEETCIKF